MRRPSIYSHNLLQVLLCFVRTEPKLTSCVSGKEKPTGVSEQEIRQLIWNRKLLPPPITKDISIFLWLPIHR